MFPAFRSVAPILNNSMKTHPQIKTTPSVASKALIAALVFIGTLFCFLTDGASAALPHTWTGNPASPYGLTDFDHFSDAYHDCKWGNLMDQSVQGQTLGFTALTQPIWNTTNTDLFLNDGTSTLHLLSPPSQWIWSNVFRTVDVTSFSQIPLAHNYALYRYLHFKNTLTDEITNHLLPSDTSKVIVVIHGWNPTSDPAPYSNSDEWLSLKSNLRNGISASSGWKLVFYDWHEDADTGPAININLLNPDNPTRTAEIAHLHGQHLGELLAAIGPAGTLQKVHFISHSGGAWAARSAARYLTETTYAKIQITLLDPFMPNKLGASTSLTDTVMSNASQMDAITANTDGSQAHQLYLLENYYTVDSLLQDPGNIFGDSDILYGATSATFAWRPRDINLRVDWNDGTQIHYPKHSGPILFYSDTIRSPGVLVYPGYSSKLGWQTSMFYQEPIVNPLPDLVKQYSVGNSVTLFSFAKIRGTQGGATSAGYYAWQTHSATAPDGQWTTLASGSTIEQLGTYSVPNYTFAATSILNGASFRLAFSNDAGTDVSNAVTLHVGTSGGTVPARPTGLTASAVSSNQINLSWNDNSGNENGFIVQRKIGATGIYATISTNPSPLPANSTAYFDTGLSQGTPYYYQVIATGSPNSDPSNEASASTQANTGSRILTVNSVNPGGGVHVYASPNDANGLADGNSSFSRQYTSSITATLVAPATWSGNTFQKWQKDGQDWTTSTVANVVMDTSHTMVAVYTTQTGTNYTIAVSASPSNGGTVTGNGSYPANSQATIQATAAQGYTFLNWTRNTSGQNGGTTFAVQPQVQFQATSNLSLVANFTQNANNNYTVTTTAEPADGGTASGAGSYSPSSNVSLSAQPAIGYVFDYWTENGVVISYIQNYQYPQISQAHNFVAHFHVRGSGTPDLVPSMALDRQFYFPGDIVSITGDVKNKGAVASNSCQLYWVVSDMAASAPQPASFTGDFSSIYFWMSFYPGIPAGASGGVGVGLPLTDFNGTALAPGSYYMWMLFDPGNTDGETAENRVNNNLVVPFTVLPLPPNNGPDLISHDFSATPAVTFPSGTLNVKGGIRNVGNVASTGFKYYVSISTSATVAPDKNALNVSGTVPGLGVYVDAGADSSFSLPGTLAPGNYYLWIMVDPENSAGEPAGNCGNNSIILPLTIAQPLQTFTINASASSITAGSVSGGGVYPAGGLVPVVATPASGYQFVNWTENGTSVSPALIYSFTATDDRNLVANFAVITPFYSWQTSHFNSSQLSQPSLSGWNGDANGSGIPNGLKFFFNLNPTGGLTASDSSALPRADVEMSGGIQYLTLTYRQNPQASAVGVQLQVSPDMTPNSWLPVTPDFTVALTPDPITGDPRTKVMVNTRGEGKKFIRLQVTGP
jgi:hypothetical protein